jgi:enoyl-CoA hydratase/long-chain 3-hydroxyacyl-CoA dehydrogenase
MSFLRGIRRSSWLTSWTRSSGTRAPLSTTAPTTTTTTPNGKFVQLEVKDGIGIVRLDTPDSKVNVLSRALQSDFEAVLRQVESDKSIRAAVIISSKPDSFIAGADINMLAACKSADELANLGRSGRRLFDALLASGKPKVAAINGPCLGGGLEVALACTYRIASSSAKTSLALPEVMLGLLPGAGGTVRLPRLIGIQAALPMLLTGKSLKASAAKKAGLVDGVADPAALEQAAILAARQLADGTLKPVRSFSGVKGWTEYALTRTSVGRNFVFKKAREQVMQQTAGKYPAPLAICDVVEKGYESGVDAGFEAEATRFGQLGMTPESRALISIFHGQTALKKNRFATAETKPLMPKIDTIGVLGAGLMGAGIAQVSIAKGYTVLLKDAKQAGLDRGIAQIAGNLAADVKKRRITQPESERTLSSIYTMTGDNNLWRDHFKRAGLVIEAVFEDLALKHKVVRELEEVVGDKCIIASNTSALPIRDIASASKRPENVVGMHYFSPVDKMPLLEIITHAGTAPHVTAAAFEVGARQGKTVIIVKDVPGFYVNRCLGPYMAEVMALVQLGVEPQRLDKIMRDFGFPVGPTALADQVGVDVASHVQKFLGANLGARMQGAVGGATLLENMLKAQLFGRKSGAGFYVYEKEDGKKKKTTEKVDKALNPAVVPLLAQFRAAGKQVQLSDDEIQFRAVARFVNEAAHCVADGIVASPVDADIGAVFGIGFPPFRGGPFRWLDQVGVKRVVDRMRGLERDFGPQFAPAPILVDYAATAKKFHSD